MFTPCEPGETSCCQQYLGSSPSLLPPPRFRITPGPAGISASLPLLSLPTASSGRARQIPIRTQVLIAVLSSGFPKGFLWGLGGADLTPESHSAKPPGQRCPQPPGGRWTCSPVRSPHLSKPGILKQGSPVSSHTTRVGASPPGVVCLQLFEPLPHPHIQSRGSSWALGGQVPFFHGVFPRQPLGEGRETAP